MNKSIKVMASTMIILSILFLIIIFTSYYNSRETTEIKPPHVSGENVSKSETTKEESIFNSSGENNLNEEMKDIIETNDYVPNQIVEENVSGEIDGEASGEITIESGELNHDENLSDIVIYEKDGNKEPVISSNVETSDEEKRQVLNELDSALQGLLEAVRKSSYC